MTYNVDGFLEKNRDTLSDCIMRCMRGADASLVYELFSPLSEFGQLQVRCDQFKIYTVENWLEPIVKHV